MSTKLKNVILLTHFSILTCLIAFYVSFFFTEKFFFDKVFLEKSALHGYLHVNQLSKLEIFGQRSEGERALREFSSTSSKKVLGEYYDADQKQKPFLVIIIGDSFVWGQGVRNESLFPVLLEKKLNSIRPAKVLAFGFPGDTIFDYYKKYRTINEIGLEPDLVIFGLVDNDLILQNYFDENSDTDMQRIFHDCTGPLIKQKKDATYEEEVLESFKDGNKNFCAFSNLLDKLPKRHAIYFNFWPVELQSNVGIITYIKSFQDNGFRVTSPLNEMRSFVQKNDFQIGDIPDFHVSQIDYHPSATAHEIFAQSLFNEITNNNELGFKITKDN
ncbi:MAG: SGNH/GDSL hydrolase family protein [Patescibacteria group bacterium]